MSKKKRVKGLPENWSPDNVFCIPVTPKTDLKDLRVGITSTGNPFFRIAAGGSTNSYDIKRQPKAWDRFKYTLTQMIQSQRIADELIRYLAGLLLENDANRKAGKRAEHYKVEYLAPSVLQGSPQSVDPYEAAPEGEGSPAP
jgi:hypothetical protein